MNKNDIIQILSNVFILVVAYITKKISDKSKSEIRQSNAEIRVMKLELGEHSLDIQQLKDSDDSNKKKHAFDSDLLNAIIGKASTKINENDTLSDNFVISSSLTAYFEKIAEFAQMFNNSNLRRNTNITVEEFKSHLTLFINSYMYFFINQLETGIKDEKGFITGNKLNYIKFSEYFATINKNRKEPDCFAFNENLTSDLAHNGLTEKTLKQKFITYTSQFIDEFKRTYKSFNELEDYDKLLEKTIN